MKILQYLSLLCCLNLALTSTCFALLKFERFSLQEGLSHASVYTLYQDQKGFIWVGTRDGLNRFDGQQFRKYRHQPQDNHSLSHNSVSTLTEDQDGFLWVGTDNGLNRFNPLLDHFTRYLTEPHNPHSLSHHTVWSIQADDHNRLWVGTAAGGLNRFEPDTERFAHYKHDPQQADSLSDNSVWTVYQDSQKRVWVGTDGFGLNRLLADEKGFKHYLPEHNIAVLHEDAQQRLWVGTKQGLFYYSPHSDEFVRYKIEGLAKVWALTSDHEGYLWVGTDGNGLYQIHLKDTFWTKHLHDPNDANSLSNNAVLSLLTDRSGSIWVGTDRGLNRIDPGYNQFRHYTSQQNKSNTLSNPNVLSILQTRCGALWVGTENGLNHYDVTRKTVTQYQHDVLQPHSLSHNKVWALYQDRSARIWVGTEGGVLSRFDTDSQTFIHYPLPHHSDSDMVRSIYQDQSGMLWVGARSGLYFFDSKKETVNPKFTDIAHIQNVQIQDGSAKNTPISPAVMNIYEDSQNRLWVSTLSTGLFCFAADRSQAPVHYQFEAGRTDSLSGDQITNVLEDKFNDVWISTFGSGLNKLLEEASTQIPGGRFQHYREADGLPNDFIHGLLSDEAGFLWLSTNQGIARFAPQTPEQGFKHYNVLDGLQSSQFNAAYAKGLNGELFFGGVNGFNGFFPAQFKANRYPPSVAMTELEIFNKVITPHSPNSPLETVIDATDQLTLPYWQSFFSLKFAALNFIQPSKNQYAYRLVGFNSDWQPIKNRRQAFFTNVPPGNYRFEIKATNNEGVWGPVNDRLHITITPPFWKTWWAYLMYACLLSIMLWKLILRYRHLLQARQQARLDQEILQRKQTEAALHESEERYRLLVEGTENLVIQVDRQGRFLYANQAAERIFQMSAEELPGQSLFDFIHPQDKEGGKVALQHWLEQKPDTITFSNRLISRGNTIRYMLWTIHPVFDHLGKVRAFSSIAKDVTELKRVEDEMLKAKEQAERANRAKSEFLANMSHEIRTPMNAILGFTDILSHLNPDIQQKEYLSAISTSGKSLLKLINDILDLSKVEAGKLELEYHCAAPRALFEDMQKIFMHKLQAKQLSFILDIPDDLPEHLLLDETRIRQVLLNLMGNATKFTDQGGITLKIWFAYLGQQQDFIQLNFSVSDTGIGISNDQKDSIFGAFEQQRNQSHAKYGGTGLGLAISKRLVEMMDGNIRLHSVQGQGSLFTVTLNQVKVLQVSHEAQNVAEVTTAAPTHFAPATVLIADDVLLNRKLLKVYLSSYPFTLLEANNGEEAVTLTKQHQPALILMDMKMPVLDGDAATRMLKSNEQLKHIPVIALTALAMKEDEEKIRHLCDGYLSKPVSKKALVQTLAQFLPMQADEEGVVDTVEPEASSALLARSESLREGRLSEDLCARLKQDYLPRIAAFESHSSINDIEDFALAMKNLAQQYHSAKLLNWAEQLYQNTQLFDLPAIHLTLKQFSELLKTTTQNTSSD